MERISMKWLHTENTSKGVWFIARHYHHSRMHLNFLLSFILSSLTSSTPWTLLNLKLAYITSSFSVENGILSVNFAVWTQLHMLNHPSFLFWIILSCSRRISWLLFSAGNLLGRYQGNNRKHVTPNFHL